MGQSRPGFPVLGVGLIAGASAAGLYFSAQSGYLLGQIGAIVIGGFGLHGLWRGGFRKMIMLPLTVGMLYFMAAKPDFADPVVQMVAGKPSPMGNMLACGLTMVVTFLGAGMLVKFARNRVILKRRLLTGLDRLGGSTLGIAEGAVVVLAVCWASVMMESQMARLRTHPGTAEGSQRQKIANSMLQIVREVDAGPLRTLVRDHNLLEQVPAVRNMLDQMAQTGSANLGSMLPAGLLEQIDTQQLGELGDVVKQLQQDTANRGASYQRLPAAGR